MDKASLPQPDSIESRPQAGPIQDKEEYYEEPAYDKRYFFLGDSNIHVAASDQHDQNHHHNKSLMSQSSANDDNDESETECSLDEELPSTPTSMIGFETSLDNGLGRNQVVNEQAFEDGSIVFGTIRLYARNVDGSGPVNTFIKGNHRDDKYPNALIDLGIHKRWIRLDGLSIGTLAGVSHVRVYIVPEDVNRSNRGSIQQFRKLVRYLSSYVDCSLEAWTGKADPHGKIQIYEEPISEDEESLFYIFNTLKSPQPSASDFKGNDHALQAMSEALEDKVPGLKTSLYPYQRRSIAAMIKKESDPIKIGDPRKTPFRDMLGNTFYMDLHEGALFRNQPLYTESQGGILAETMGYGKTLICLALILATRGHYPRIPQDRVDNISLEPREKTASLFSMAAKRLKHEGVPWKKEIHALSKEGFYCDHFVKELNKYEREYHEPIFHPTTPNRKGKRESANTVRLCSTTLIVVPPNLLIQWDQEIKKHIEDNALDYLIIGDAATAVPEWQKLIKYDLIVMSKARFEQEYRDDDLNQGKSTRGDSRYRSPLTDVRWLRVICDEGHGFAGSSSRTNAIAMLDKMFIERRWVVSGTPSRTLHGVEVDLASSQTSSACQVSDRRRSVNSALEGKKRPETQDIEIKDLERLRLIVVNFLKLQPWANQRGSTDKAYWKKYLTPITTPDGSRRSRPALREILQTLIVRHQINDVDADLALPPLYNRLVYLKPSYYDKLTINLFVMVLTSNYVTSEREDEDYMFHSRNRKKFDLLLNNLCQATFFWCGFTETMMQDTLRVSNAYLDDKMDTISDADGMLIMQAIMTGERALADPSWKAFSVLHEIGVYITAFPEHARGAWALDNCDSNPLLLGSVQARVAQKHISTKLADSDPLAGLAGAGVKVMAAARNKADEEQTERRKARDQKGETEEAVASEEPKLKGASKSSSPSKISKSKKADSKQKNPPALERIRYNPELAATQVLGFTSAKLTYLMDQVLQHSPFEKIIIFYSHNNVAFWVAEALELLHVTFLIYANTLAIAERAKYLDQFNSDIETRVLLMDLKQAGQGLHVAAASRVYIISPIWEKSVESQAIKRAHRIGQTRPVYVETLVLQGTFEELMMQRRREKDERRDVEEPKLSKSTKTKGTNSTAAAPGRTLLDDNVMVRVLKDIQFLRFTKNDEKIAMLTTPQPLFAPEKLMASHKVASNNVQSSILAYSRTSKKKRTLSPERSSSAKRAKLTINQA